MLADSHALFFIIWGYACTPGLASRAEAAEAGVVLTPVPYGSSLYTHCEQLCYTHVLVHWATLMAPSFLDMITIHWHSMHLMLVPSDSVCHSMVPNAPLHMHELIHNPGLGLLCHCSGRTPPPIATPCSAPPGFCARSFLNAIAAAVPSCGRNYQKHA